MTTKLEFAITSGFILDDPIAGVLDNVDYPLGGENYQDITQYMITAGISRGKSRDLDRFSAGALRVTLNNEQRIFDPNYTSGPYYGDIKPRTNVRMTVDSIVQYQGVIDDWNFTYAPKERSKAEIVATDDFTYLARQLLTPGTATPQGTGDRVSAVLDMESVAWPADRRNIDTGSSSLGADLFDGNALEYLQKVETSEQGQLFISKDGDLTFRGSSDAAPKSAGLVTFADDGTGIPYTEVLVNYGTELLVNTVNTSSAAGTAIAKNERSRTSYGVVEEDIETLLADLGQVRDLADFTVQKYGDPEYRFNGVSMNLDTMSAPNRASVLGLEIGDVVLVKFTPNSVGNAIEQYGQIIAIDHDIEQSRHDMQIGLASLDFTSLVLDDALFGTMDNNSLGF